MQRPHLARTVAICAGLILTILFVYTQVGGFEFVGVDDFSYVADNPHVRSGLSKENVLWAFTTTSETHWAPLTWISFMLDAEVGGGSPQAFHLTNLALHAADTLLLFYALVLMTGALWRSGFVASLFAIHPLHVESVAWITERKDVLSAMFWLLCVVAYARYAERPGPARFAAVMLAFVLGLMSKSMVVTLPFVLAVLDWWPLRRLDRTPVTRLAVEKIPLLVLAVGASVLAVRGQVESQTLGTLGQFPLHVRAANAAVSCTTYIQKTFWPSRLAVFYPYWPDQLTLLRVSVSVVLIAGVSVLALVFARSRPFLLVGWLWYLIALLPVIGLVQAGAQSMADRYTYIPLIGVFIMIAWGLPDLLDGIASRMPASPRTWLLGARTWLLGVGAGIALALLAWVARIQASHWRTTNDLLTHALAVTERNPLAHNGLGLDLFERGRYNEAIAHEEEALKLWPSYLEAKVNLAAALTRAGRNGEALARYREAHHLRPDDAAILAHLGAALLQQGMVEEAAARLQEAVRVAPDDSFAQEQLGVALSRMERDDEAIEHLREAARITPDDAEAAVNLGTALAKRGRLAEAETELGRALRISPGSSSAHKNLGVVLARQDRIEAAIEQFAEAVRIDPADERARKNLEHAQRLLRERR